MNGRGALPQTTEAKRAYDRIYRQDHKEERHAYQVAYCEEHRDAIREMKAAYYEDHKEEIAARYEDHKDEKRSYNVAYYELNRGSIRERYAKEYAEFHEWLQILRTVNGCEDCETHEGWLEHHHVDPSTKKFNISGMWGHSLDALEEELEKCVVLCSLCHKARHKVLKSVKSKELLAMEEIGKAREPLCSLPTLFIVNTKQSSCSYRKGINGI